MRERIVFLLTVIGSIRAFYELYATFPFVFKSFYLSNPYLGSALKVFIDHEVISWLFLVYILAPLLDPMEKLNKAIKIAALLSLLSSPLFFLRPLVTEADPLPEPPYFNWREMRWQYPAIVTWTAALGLSLLLYLRKVSSLKALCLAYASICFSSVFYEIGWLIESNCFLAIAVKPKFMLSSLSSLSFPS